MKPIGLPEEAILNKYLDCDERQDRSIERECF